MIEKVGDFWQEVGEYVYNAICCTTNTFVKYNGDLTMGAGIALDFRNKFPFLPELWGKIISTRQKAIKSNIIVTKYDIHKCVLEVPQYIVAFPTKYHWKNDSDINLIKESTEQLVCVANALCWPDILLPRPGCYMGGLNWETQVKPILEPLLDDRFTIITNRKS